METTIFSDILLPGLLVIIMFSLGLSITFQDIKNIVVYPGNIIIGLLSQMILLPLIAFSIAFLSNLEPVYKVGLIIISVCPGGATSNLVNFMLRANVALSLSITVVHGFITLINIPLIVSLALWVFMKEHTHIEMPVKHAVVQIFLLTITPAAIGVLIRAWKEKVAGRMEDPLRYILPVLLLIVYSGVIFLEGGEQQTDVAGFLYLVPFTLGLNIVAMFSGYYVPRVLRVGKRNAVTIAVEVGLQNSALAMFVAGTLLDNYKMSLVAVVYGSFSFFTTWFFGYITKKYL